jgi:hypothetical protein
MTKFPSDVVKLSTDVVKFPIDVKKLPTDGKDAYRGCGPIAYHCDEAA